LLFEEEEELLLLLMLLPAVSLPRPLPAEPRSPLAGADEDDDDEDDDDDDDDDDDEAGAASAPAAPLLLLRDNFFFFGMVSTIFFSGPAEPARPVAVLRVRGCLDFCGGDERGVLMW
jgi:hypothetical protein